MTRLSLRNTALATIFLMVPAVVSAETFNGALEKAYEYHPSLKVALASVVSARDALVIAEAGKGPSVSASANAGLSATNEQSQTSNTSSLSLTSSWTLWDGGETNAQISSAGVDIARAEQSLSGTVQSVLLTAATAYSDVLEDEQNLTLAQNNVRVIREQLSAAQQRYAVGEVTRTEVAQADARLSAARSNLVASEGALEVSRQAYLAAIGELPGDLAPVPPLPPMPADLAEAYRIALITQPDVLDAELSLEDAKYSVDEARAAYAMTVSANASAGASRSAADTSSNSASVSVTASMPIYTGGALPAGLRRAETGVLQAQANLDNVVRQTKAAVANAWSNMEVFLAAITASQQEIRAARIAFQSVREEARLGARTTLETLDAEQDLLDAQSNLVAAERNYFVAAFSLLEAMGLLTPSHLSLEVTELALPDTDGSDDVSPIDRALGRW